MSWLRFEVAFMPQNLKKDNPSRSSQITRVCIKEQDLLDLGWECYDDHFSQLYP